MPAFLPAVHESERGNARALEAGTSSSNRVEEQFEVHQLKLSSGRIQLLLSGLILIGAMLRVIATRNDLWLDEIISLKIAQSVKTPWQIFTAVHSDNNHYLNTIFLYLMKGHTDGAADRYFSVLLGVGLIPAGYWLLARRSRWEGLLLGTILAFSYPLIHFSSEGRGYSGAVLGLTLACGALTRWMAGAVENQTCCHSDERSKEESAVRASPKSVKGRFLPLDFARGSPAARQIPLGMTNSVLLGVVYSASLILAFLSHLTAVLIWFALAVASLMAVAGRSRSAKWIGQWAAFNTVPVAVLFGLYFFDLRYLSELGGSPMTVIHGLNRLLALGLGWPAKDAISLWILMLPLSCLIISLRQEKKSGEPLWGLLAGIYVLPLLCTLAMRPTFFSPRYFLVVLPFFCAAVAMLLARLARVQKGPLAVALLLVIFFAGQMRLYAKFLQVGRGQYRAALTYMMAHTNSADVTVASNQDFRSRVELAYYVPRVMGRRQLLYGPVEGNGGFQPEWYILHQEGYEAPGPQQWVGPGQTMWHRAAYFGASELSGQAWTIYRRQAASASNSN